MELGFQLADPSTSGPEFSGFAGRNTVEFTAVDTVLPDPVREGDGMDAEFLGRLLLLFPARTSATARARNSLG